LAFFAVATLFASELAPLSDGEAAIEFGLVILFSAAVFLGGSIIIAATTLLNAVFLIWVLSIYHIDLDAVGAIPYLEFLILGTGILAVLLGGQYRRTQSDGATSAQPPAATQDGQPGTGPAPGPSARFRRDSSGSDVLSGIFGPWRIDTEQRVVGNSDSPLSSPGLSPPDGRHGNELSTVRLAAEGPILWDRDRLAAPEVPYGHDDSQVGGIALATRRDATSPSAHVPDGASSNSVLELRHRLSNLFPAIIALAKLMETQDGDVEHYKQALIERIQALQAAHQLLSRHPSEAGLLWDIVALTLNPYHREHNITIRGPSVTMSEGTAESFALIVHELATNSLKHGALGTPGGRVKVEWSMAGDCEDDIVFLWTEQGRQPKVRSGRVGFGSSILGADGPPLVGHASSLEMLDDGLRYTLRLPRSGAAL